MYYFAETPPLTDSASIEPPCTVSPVAACVVLVFYYDTSGAVNDSHDVALEVVDAAIERSVEARHRRAGLRIVEVYCLKTVPEA